MAGRILIVDDIATNRIVMKVKLSTAHYHVLQAASGSEAVRIAESEQPDLILLDIDLPDMSGSELIRILRQTPATQSIPIIAVTGAADRDQKLAALSEGADEFLCKPLDDLMLLARVRSLLRARDAEDELRLRDGTSRALGFAEGETDYEAPARIALIAPTRVRAETWKTALKDQLKDKLIVMTKTEALENDNDRSAPDVYMISAHLARPEEGLQLLTDLRSRANTRHAAIVIVLPEKARRLSAMALDLGANDLISEGFDPEELTQRLRMQVRRKRQADRLRARVKDGLRAAVIDPLTGLYNRRYAMPHLIRIAERARTTDKTFALMLLDLDRFKSVNDVYGHGGGDAVLIDVAARLRDNVRAVDLVARIGGEEFLVAMPDTSLHDAKGAANRLCRLINQAPVALPNGAGEIDVSVSIGLAMGGGDEPADAQVERLMQLADRALYGAKSDGRNQVTVDQSAA